MLNVKDLSSLNIKNIKAQPVQISASNNEATFQMKDSSVLSIDNSDSGDLLLFDLNIPNQDIEYLGREKVKQLTQLFCQQVNNEYSDFSKLSAEQQEKQLHKLKGAAIALGLVRLHHLCQQLESYCQTEQLSKQQLNTLEQLITLSSVALNQYAKNM